MKLDEAMRRAAAGDPGRPGTAHRLYWVLLGAAGWQLRAIAREEGIKVPSEPAIVREAVRRGLVRRILRLYLWDLEGRLVKYHLAKCSPDHNLEQLRRTMQRKRRDEKARRARLAKTGVRRSL